MPSSIVAVMGFDWRHVVKSILRIGFREVVAVHLIMPVWDNERARAGVNEVRKVATAAGLSEDAVHVYRVDPRNFLDAVAGLIQYLSRVIADSDTVLVSLGGGMRALVVETFTALLSLGEVFESFGRATRVVIDLEGMAEAVEFRLTDALSIIVKPPSEEEGKVLILAYERGAVRPKDISEALAKPRSTAHAMLKDLEKRGYLRKVRRGVYELTDLGMAHVRVFSNARA